MHDRLAAGEMPPKEKKRPDPSDTDAFLKEVTSALTAYENEVGAREEIGRAHV